MIFEQEDKVHRLVIKDVRKDEAGQYTVKATNDVGTLSAKAKLKVIGNVHFSFWNIIPYCPKMSAANMIQVRLLYEKINIVFTNFV